MYTTNAETATLIIVGTILMLLFGAVIVLLYVLFQNKKNKLLQEKELANFQFIQALQTTQVEIQEQTLKKISEEIHDNICQRLSTAKFGLGTIEIGDNDDINNTIKDCISNVADAIHNLRDISRSLNSDAIEKTGLENALKNELSIISRLGINAQVIVNGTLNELNPKIQLILFRIIQECVNNTIKHAQAKNLTITLNYNVNNLETIITDNGIGFNVNTISLKGIGLTNIQNRCKVINAVLTIDSIIGSGTEIKIITKYL